MRVCGSVEMDLEPERADILRMWAANTASVYELWLFGSRAKGTSTPESDVDLAIVLMPENDDGDWAYADYVQNSGKWKKQLISIVARPVSLEVIECEEPLESEVHATGVRLWKRDII